MTDVNVSLNNSLNVLVDQIARKLDKKDGASDNKIKGSIWNAFVADKGGQTINEKETINVTDATKLIEQYAKNVSEDDLAQKWLNSIDEPVENKPEPNNSPKTVPTPETKVTLSKNITMNDIAELNNDVYDEENNLIWKVSFSKVNKDTEQKFVNEFDKDGNKVNTFIFNKNGQLIEKAEYNSGTVVSKYDTNGKVTEEVRYDENGNKYSSDKMIYDSSGKLTKKISLNEKDEVFNRQEFKYDKSGKIVEWNHFDKNGNKIG